MNMKIQRCKGTRDLSPDEMSTFRLIEDTFRESCRKWGYQEVRTPTLEYLHLFTSTGTLTPDRLSRVYSFLDWDGWSGERVVLRPDGTIPVARLYIDSLEDEALARLFYIANVFTFEETGKQNRERWQCGTELIGAGSPQADVELIALALEVLRGLGIGGVRLRLFHAGIIRALLDSLGLEAGEQARIFDRILDGDAGALAKVEQERPELAKALSLLNVKGKSSGFLKNLKSLFKTDLPGLQTAIDDFVSLTGRLEALGIDYQIDIASGRGFEYYTGVIFQFLHGRDKIGGGGRYDALIPLLGGRDRPASGFALYLDRLMGLVAPPTTAEPAKRNILVRLTPEATREGFAVARALREAGYNAEFCLGVPRPVEFGWTLDIKGEPPVFVLAESSGRRLEVKSAAAVLAAIKGTG
jgi:histidyl-tRNA synthetase